MPLASVYGLLILTLVQDLPICLLVSDISQSLLNTHLPVFSSVDLAFAWSGLFSLCFCCREPTFRSHTVQSFKINKRITALTFSEFTVKEKEPHVGTKLEIECKQLWENEGGLHP